MKRLHIVGVLLVMFSLFPPLNDLGAAESPSVKDIKAEWYFPEWLGTSPYSPVFEIKDTENKYGRYAAATKPITIKDLIKFHGHFCGDFAPKDVDLFQELQWAYAKRIVNRPLKDSFILDQPKAYAWPESSCPDFGKRKDNDYKNTPEK